MADGGRHSQHPGLRQHFAQTIKTGAWKDSGSMYRPMTEKERKRWHTVIDDSYQRFVRVLSPEDHGTSRRIGAGSGASRMRAATSLAGAVTVIVSLAIWAAK